MKYKILRVIALLLLLVHLSSCFQGRWRHYHDKHFYMHKKHFSKWHRRHNGDW